MLSHFDTLISKLLFSFFNNFAWLCGAGVASVGVVVRSGGQSRAGSTSRRRRGRERRRRRRRRRARVRGVRVESLLRTGRARRQDVRHLRVDRLRRAAAASSLPRPRSSSHAALDLRKVATLALSSAARPLAATLPPRERTYGH